MTRKEIDVYLRKVKRNCPFSFRKRLVKELRENLLDYMEENPEDAMDKVIEFFGAPETFSYNYILAMEDQERQKLVKQSRRIKTCALGIVIVWLIVLTVRVVWNVREDSKHIGYYYMEWVEYDDMEALE